MFRVTARAAKMSESNSAERRNDVIDAFRGVAILSVMGFHYLVTWAPPQHLTDPYGYTSLNELSP